MPKSTLPAALLAFVLGLVLCLFAMKFVVGDYNLSDGFMGISPANMKFGTMVGGGVGVVSALLTMGIAVSQKLAWFMAILLPVLGAVGFGVFLAANLGV